MNKKQLLSVGLVVLYFIMGVATSQYPQMGRTPMPRSTVNINDSKHILFYESFQNNQNNWLEGKYAENEFYFEKGYYHIKNQHKNNFSLADVNQTKVLNEADDWIIESEMRIPNENLDGTAYILYGKQGDDFHCFGFSQNGNQREVYYGSRQKGEWKGEIVKLGSNAESLFNPTLSIHKMGSRLHYYLNKQFIASGPVYKFYGDEFGLAVGGLLTASFDNFTVKQLQFLKEEPTYSTDKKKPVYQRGDGNVIPMRKRAALYVMPMTVNESVSTEFAFDQWTTDAVISETLAKKMIEAGSIKKADWVGDKPFLFSDGSTAPATYVVLRKLKVGNRTIENVDAFISKNAKAEILIGPSVLSMFGNYKLDVQEKVLVFESE
jgi:predicted aspartyl protease